MAVDAVLLESPTMRAVVSERVEVLDRVKALVLLPDGVHVTTEAVAEYFGVGEKAVYSLVDDHRDELAANGRVVLTGPQLTFFKEVCQIQSRARSLALFSRRAVLNVAMLLRDSETARQVRCHLLDAEQNYRLHPVDNPVYRPVDNRSRYPEGSVDAAVARVVRDVIGTAVVPVLNALVLEVGRNSRKLDELGGRVERLERVVLGAAPGRGGVRRRQRPRAERV